MRSLAKIAPFLAVAFLCSTYVAVAVPSPGRSCATIQWNAQFLDAYPKAAAACRQVTEVNGIQYAEFHGIVSRVDHDVIQVVVSDVIDIPISTIAFLMGRDGQVVTNAEGKRVGNLTQGDHLTFWIREGRFGVSPTLTEPPMLIVRPERVEQLIENLGLPDHFVDLQ